MSEPQTKGHADPCIHFAKPIHQHQHQWPWTFRLLDGTVHGPLHRGCGPKWYRANRSFAVASPQTPPHTEGE